MRKQRQEIKELPKEEQLKIFDIRRQKRINRRKIWNIASYVIICIIVALAIIITIRPKLLAKATELEYTSNVLANVDVIAVPTPTPIPKMVEEIKQIDYQTIEGKASSELPKGMAIAYTKGEKGEEKIVKEVSYDGEEKLISKDIVRRPSQVTVSRGTSKKRSVSPIVLSLFDFPEQFEEKAVIKTISAKASAYIPGTVASCGNTASISKSGVPLKTGAKAIAVDTRVIPLGSLVYVKSTDGKPDYGYCIAVDIGGAIKGNRVDVAIYSLSSPFNTVWPVKVYVLDPNKIDFYKI